MPPDDGGWGASIEIWDVARRSLLFEHGVQGDTGGPARREERNPGGRSGGGPEADRGWRGSGSSIFVPLRDRREPRGRRAGLPGRSSLRPAHGDPAECLEDAGAQDLWRDPGASRPASD